MEVRILTPENAALYWELRLESLKQNPEAFATSYEEAIQRKNPIEQVANNLRTEGNYTFGAFEQHKLIGMVTLLQESSLKLNHRANIFAMYVSPDARGLGVGKALLIEAIKQAHLIDGLEKINLSVVSSNEAAKALYTKLGFKAFGREEKALKVNDTYYEEEHMALLLNK